MAAPRGLSGGQEEKERGEGEKRREEGEAENRFRQEQAGQEQ